MLQINNKQKSEGKEASIRPVRIDSLEGKTLTRRKWREETVRLLADGP
jgi:hypothetical protein